MKNVIKIVLFLGVIICTAVGCDEEEKEKTPVLCDIENPQENIEWLSNLLQKSFCVEIYSIQYNGQEYIGVYECPIGADYGSVYYDCEGNKFCQHTGITGQWDCDDDFIEAVKNKVFVYKQETNPIWD